MSTKSYTPVQRETLIAHAKCYLAEGLSLYAACKFLGVAQSCMTKWLNPPPPRPAQKTGRPRAVVLTEAETKKLKQLILQFNSVPVAVEELLIWEDITDATRQALGVIANRARNEGKAPSWPVTVLEVSKIPECIEALHRGRKHAREFEPKARRDGTLTMEDGSSVLWAPGWIYESDDESINEPYRFFDPALGRETTGRQGLFTLDAASTCHLQADLCGRPCDAYRVEDIADHMLNVVQTHGLPVLWRLEMGSWASNFILGILIKGREKRWGSLNDLCYISNKHESTGKANIERSFNEQQKRTAHASTSIGRERGEFENATAIRRRADKGNEDALRYFWPMAEAADSIAESLRGENIRPRRFPKLGNIHTTPGSLFAQRVQRRDLAPQDEWYFCPVKRQATIRRGVIQVKVEHYEKTFRFITYGVEGFPVFKEGHPVLIAFHPAHPERGCHVFNACETANAKGIAWGEKIGIADHFPDVPEEVLNGTGDFKQISKAKAHLRAEYRTIVPAGTGPGTLKSIARDGLGNALEIQRNGTPPPQTGGSRPDGVVPPAPRPVREIRPAISSRPMPADPAAEIRRLQASLAEV